MKKIIFFIKNNFKKIIKFGLTGGLGTLTNIFVFFITNSILKINYIICSILAFLVAVTQNYFLNSIWTFNQNKSFKKYIKFVFISVFGLIVNLIVLTIFVELFKIKIPILGQIVGIFAGMIFNYLGSHFFIFSK
jgi:putative flippase GtrA